MSGTPGGSANRPSVASLRKRWSRDHVDDIGRQLLAQSRIARPPHTLVSPWGRTDDGATDLRGLPSRGPAELSFKFVTLAGVDLGGASGRFHVHESVFVDSRFDGATMTAGSRLDRRFDRCGFRSATLRDVRLGRTLVECDFTGARMRKLSLGENTRFERCTFAGADLSDARLVGATFVDCAFDDVTLSALTTIRRCEFLGAIPPAGPAQLVGCRRDGVALPDRWHGASDAATITNRYVSDYVEAIRDGREDVEPLAPESPHR